MILPDASVTFSFTRLPAGPIARQVDFARYGRDLGYTRCWVSDQTYYADPFVLLAAASAAVPELELGLAVTNPYTRHPVQIARAAASIAELHPRRFWLGLGAGNRKHLLERLGIDGTHAPARVRDAVVVVRRLLAGETVDYDGFWTLRGIRLEGAPPPPVPIVIATRNPRMLRVAGEVADGVMLESLVSAKAQAYGLAHVRAGLAAAGRDGAGFEVVAWQSVLVTDDRHAGIEVLRPWATYLLGMTTRATALEMGIRPEVVDRVHAAFRTGGTEAAFPYVGPDEVDRVVIVGPPEHVAARCTELLRGGATDFAVQAPADERMGRETLRRFAEEVRPLVERALKRPAG